MKPGLSFLALCAFLIPETAFPENGQVYEAENISEPDAIILKCPEASRGLYVSPAYDGCSLVSIEIPADQPVEIWVRHQGLPLLLKSRTGLDISSPEGQSNSWLWDSLGVVNAADVGGGVEIFSPFAQKEIIAGEPPPTPSGIDMVILAPPGSRPSDLDRHVEPLGDFSIPDVDAVIKLPSGSDKEKGGSVSATISVDWNSPTVRTTRRQFSINVFGGFDPALASDPRYAENIAYMAPGTLRYHCMSITRDPGKASKSWLNEDLKTWNRAKIGESLDALPRDSYERVITIGKWPDWMDANNDGLLDTENYEAFAALCADLVRIINVEQKRNVRFFEITNERDITYWLAQMKTREPLQIAELAKIYNLCATAMKEVDPTILTGGPASCRGDLLEPLKHFALAALPNLDFFSYHAYAAGSPAEPDVRVFDKAQNIGRNASLIRNMLNEISPDREIEVHLNEFNICYTGRKRDPRMTNHKGAVYDALFFIEIANSGIEVSNAWNDINNVYGKMSMDYALTPSAHVFHYFNTWLTGRAFAAKSTEKRKITPFAVEQENRRTIALVNRSSYENSALFANTTLPSDNTEIEIARIDQNGLHSSTTTARALADGFKLPDFSIAFLSWEKTP